MSLLYTHTHKQTKRQNNTLTPTLSAHSSGAAEQGFKISTKNPGSLIPGALDELRARTEAAFARLRVDSVDVLYVHGPDRARAPADYAHAFDELHRAGKLRRFGISNYTPDETRALHAYCVAHDLVRPTVYQGNYNPVSRIYDDTLFPVLRELGIAFYAYSPIAGGFLTKSRKAIEDETAGGRFAIGDSIGSKMYRSLYIKPAMLDALDGWEALAREQGIPQAELAYRWVYYHSALDTTKGDSVILGASKAEQIKQTVEGLRKGPLKPEIVKGIDEVWDIMKHEAFADNIGNFDPNGVLSPRDG